MVPIPVYSSSPITAAKPTGVTPKTAQPEEPHQSSQPHPATSGVAGQAYPAAQPGATPSLPKQTAAPQTGYALPSPTQTSLVFTDNPPPPQPGAVPVPSGSGASNTLPPPPKAGESVQNQQTAPVTTMPPQMGYQAPQASLPIQGRSSTTTTAPVTAASAGIPPPTSLQGHYQSAGYSPPAGGYQQDINAAGYNQYQRSVAAHEDEGEATVWDTARKWANSAGSSLAAAEQEVWKRINKE
ncbi:hypothetical protein QQS21_002623 [Conoideocrella luteorostrata]|uniref:Uncharacterized protein n=1 Tax=Conoideocrella luteorostrata TaxID=1105319 RepID=A0AAJ0G2S6_9HYPO|nr:hypothetical protein QQS21_002623 [Conoideocrella luteorostrata]